MLNVSSAQCEIMLVVKKRDEILYTASNYYLTVRIWNVDTGVCVKIVKVDEEVREVYQVLQLQLDWG